MYHHQKVPITVLALLLAAVPVSACADQPLNVGEDLTPTTESLLVTDADLSAAASGEEAIIW